MVPKLLLALLSFAISLTAGEFGARTLWGPPAWTDLRVVFFSTQTWKRDAKGAMRYTPESVVRTVAIYGDRVEYDARFSVNNLGFIDRIDYPTQAGERNPNHIAFVGDSFTAGFHNSNPWVPRLRDRAQSRAPEIEIYNLGIGGVGVFDFTRLAKSASEQLDFQKIVFFLITEDLYRNQWQPLETHGALYLCPKNEGRKACVNGPSRMLILKNNDISVEEMFSTIEKRGLIAPTEGFTDWFTRNTFIGSRLRPLFFDQGSALPKEPKPAMIEKQLTRWLSELQAEFHDREITLVHLPTKNDIAQGHFSIDAAAHAKSAGIPYISLLEQCDFEIDDYYEIDGHPNEDGYNKLLECVGSALDLI